MKPKTDFLLTESSLHVWRSQPAIPAWIGPALILAGVIGLLLIPFV